MHCIQFFWDYIKAIQSRERNFTLCIWALAASFAFFNYRNKCNGNGFLLLSMRARIFFVGFSSRSLLNKVQNGFAFFRRIFDSQDFILIIQLKLFIFCVCVSKNYVWNRFDCDVMWSSTPLMLGHNFALAFISQYNQIGCHMHNDKNDSGLWSS